MALDRTLLAWWRTSLACYGLGLAVARILSPRSAATTALGSGFVIIGLLITALGYFDVHTAYHAANTQGRLRLAMLLLEGLLLVAGLACLALVAG